MEMSFEMISRQWNILKIEFILADMFGKQK